MGMPPSPEPTQQQISPKTSPPVAIGIYPPHAFEFIHDGLDYTVAHAHASAGPNESRHVTGQQLCQGLRELALARWGRMARTVLRRWNIISTLDFGRIVYEQIDAGQMQKVDEDSIDDFKNVYDFETAFESDYRIPSHS
jgi:uncharacterized repeat protein (TIGR04138 family)